MFADKATRKPAYETARELEEFDAFLRDFDAGVRRPEPDIPLAVDPGVITMKLGRTNTRIIYCPVKRLAAVVDPARDHESILAEARRNDLTITQIWLTHSHPENCGGAGGIIAATGARLLASGHSIESLMRRFLVRPDGGNAVTRCPELSKPLYDGELIKIGSVEFKVLHTPGHSPGHICFYSPRHKLLISGDLLYEGGPGDCSRLMMGSPLKMLRSLKEKILKLPDDTRVLPGLGGDTTLGCIKANERFKAFLAAGKNCLSH